MVCNVVPNNIGDTMPHGYCDETLTGFRLASFLHSNGSIGPVWKYFGTCLCETRVFVSDRDRNHFHPMIKIN